MAIQASISLQKNQAFIGKTMDLLVEGSDPTNNVVVGRTWRNAPEIDGFVIATGKAEVGSLKKVRLTAAMEHDFYGNLIN
jgi:ribosomal protein S12 methylthiotransferase